MNNNRILVVDDDHDLLTFYKVLLQPPQEKKRLLLEEFVNAPIQETSAKPVFAVDTTDQGEDAVLLVHQSIIEEQPYAIAFVDMRMPPGIDGLETAKRIRALDDRITIVIVTAFSDRTVDEIQQQLQHDLLFVRKPVTHDEILQHARNACIAWDDKDKERLERLHLRKRVDSLDLNSAFLLDVIGSISEGIVLCRPDRNILFLNHTAVRLIGDRVDELINRPIDHLFPKVDMMHFFETIVDYNEKPRHLHWLLETASDVSRELLVSGSVITNAHGNVHSVLLVLNDLELLRKRLQAIGPGKGFPPLRP
ncbi:MAG: response regulator [Magnetococcales bacterium]|nr:response regulator [Magnetococcales bacterium]